MDVNTVILSSDFNKDIYPDNTGGCFINDVRDDIFKSKTNIRISDISYEPGSWFNVRDKYNEMEISMKGIMVEAYVSADIYVAGRTVEKRQRQKRTPNQMLIKNQYRLILRPKGDKEYISEWTVGDYGLGSEDKNPRTKFRSIKQEDLHGFDSAPTRNSKFRVEIFVLGHKVDQEERRMKCHIPPAFYHTFPDFQLVFVKAVEEAILKIFNTCKAGPGMYNINKIQLEAFKDFSKPVDVPTAAWVFLRAFLRKTDSKYVAHLQVMRKFREMTNFQIRICKELQYQLGLTIKPFYFDVIPFPYPRLLEPEVERLSYIRHSKWGGMQMTFAEFHQDILGEYSKQYIWETNVSDEFEPNAYVTDNRWQQYVYGGKIKKAFHYYGIKGIEFNSNPITQFYIYCDIIEPSYVNNSKKQLLAMMPTMSVGSRISYEKHGMAYYKQINKTSHIQNVKIWISEELDGKPIHFLNPVTITLEYF